MSGLSSVTAVMARIGAIESRFGMTAPPQTSTATSGAATTPATPSFAASLSAAELSTSPARAPVLPP